MGGEGKIKFLRDVHDAACMGSVFILQFLDSSSLEGAQAQSGVTQKQLQDLLGASWDMDFYKFGEDALSFGRYDSEKFPPSPLFSFMVARRDRSQVAADS